jgi:histone deacetylase 1/2
LCTPTSTAYLLLYVDDIILTASTTTLLRSLITSLHQEFAMSDLGDIHHFLGVTVHRTSHGLFLSQHQYALELLERANMINCHPIATPVDTNSKLSAQDGCKVADPSHYRSIVGALQYLTLTRPGISFSINKLAQFMHKPTAQHLQHLKRILRYLKSTINHVIILQPSSNCNLVAYSDAVWGGNFDD